MVGSIYIRKITSRGLGFRSGLLSSDLMLSEWKDLTILLISSSALLIDLALFTNGGVRPETA